MARILIDTYYIRCISLKPSTQTIKSTYQHLISKEGCRENSWPSLDNHSHCYQCIFTLMALLPLDIALNMASALPIGVLEDEFFFWTGALRFAGVGWTLGLPLFTPLVVDLVGTIWGSSVSDDWVLVTEVSMADSLAFPSTLGRCLWRRFHRYTENKIGTIFTHTHCVITYKPFI